MAKPPTRGARGSGYGMRIHPIDGIYRMHYGEDGIGEGNYAPVTGTVVFAGWDNTGHGFGWAVGIRETENPTVIWWVAHHGTTSTVNPLNVTVGTTVTEGVTYLGPSGTTGAAKGRHAHTERRVSGGTRPGQGAATDPRLYYTTTSGGGGTQIPTPETPTRKKKNMTTLYWNGLPGASGAKWALAGDSPGTDANWIETTEQGLANSWATVHGAAVAVAPAWFAAFSGYYKQPVNVSGGTGGGGLTSAQNSALMGLPDAVADLPTNGELGQALTATVSLINDHADTNKDAIVAAIPENGSPANGYDLSLTIDEIPGTATGTATLA